MMTEMRPSEEYTQRIQRVIIVNLFPPPFVRGQRTGMVVPITFARRISRSARWLWISGPVVRLRRGFKSVIVRTRRSVREPGLLVIPAPIVIISRRWSWRVCSCWTVKGIRASSGTSTTTIRLTAACATRHTTLSPHHSHAGAAPSLASMAPSTRLARALLFCPRPSVSQSTRVAELFPP